MTEQLDGFEIPEERRVDDVTRTAFRHAERVFASESMSMELGPFSASSRAAAAFAESLRRVIRAAVGRAEDAAGLERSGDAPEGGAR